MKNPPIVHGAARSAVSQDTVSRDSVSHGKLYRLLGAASDPAAWERTLVDNTGTHEARAIDIDGDGLPDLVGDEENTDLLTPPRNGRVSWWQNVTAGSGTTTTTPSTTTTTTTAGGTTGTTLQIVLQPDPSTGVDTYLAGPANSDGNWGTLDA